MIETSFRRVMLIATVPLLFASERTVRADDGLAPARVLTTAERAHLATKAPKALVEARYSEMSTMGAIAAGIAPQSDLVAPPEAPSTRPGPQAKAPAPAGRLAPLLVTAIGGTDTIVHSVPSNVGQAETSLAANTAGTVIIAGYNDGRGFSQAVATGRSLSGIARSTNGGATWQDGPLFTSGTVSLPVLPSVANGQVFGDPDVKYDPVNNRWIYASIYVRPSDSLQGLSVSVSADDGATWTTPREVTPAFIAGAAADKEFIDVNTLTGRILITWTNFPAGSAQILSSFSDDGGLTWSAAVTIDTAVAGGGVQSSQPRFLPAATNATSTVYCVWRSITATGLRNERMSRSLDGGATWSAAVDIDSANFSPEDQILGVDRINTSPSMAIDYASGRVYVVYQRNNSTGEGDVALRTFVGAPAAAAPVLIDGNPGSDRAQFYPAVTVDQGSHRAHVVWYDQDAVPTGDVTEVMHTSSTDGGTTWSRPVPLTDRPFHAGYGNDTSQPNVGDYNQVISVGDNVMTTWGGTSVAPRYDEGQPTSASMDTPDTYFDKTAASATIASLRLGTATFVESNCVGVGTNGFLDPLEIGDFTFPLRNYVVNAADSPITYTGVSATLSTTTPNVTILNATQAYGSIAPGATVSNASPFQVQLGGAFVAGTYVDLVLSVTTTQGDSIDLPYRLATGSPGATTVLLNEDFSTAVVPALPAGWSSNLGGGTNVAWVTDNTSLTPGNNAAFHAEGATTKFIRLFSPIVAVPSSASPSYVEVEFDLVYNLEDEPTQGVLGYDGLTVRITDQTGGSVLRSVLAEAVAEKLTTGAANHFPKHLPRNNSAAYFQDMSVWSGNSGGTKHVSMKIPGLGMAGRSIQLRFEYTEDGSGVCATGTCGVAIDNVVVRHVVSADAHCAAAPVELLGFDAD